MTEAILTILKIAVRYFFMHRSEMLLSIIFLLSTFSVVFTVFYFVFRQEYNAIRRRIEKLKAERKGICPDDLSENKQPKLTSKDKKAFLICVPLFLFAFVCSVVVFADRSWLHVLACSLISTVFIFIVGANIVLERNKRICKAYERGSSEELESERFKNEFNYFLTDLTVWSLAICNLAIIVMAIIQSWSLATAFWVYWIQSVCIGIFSFLKIISLKEFSTKDFEFFATEDPQPTEATKINSSLVFFVVYGTSHFLYAYYLSAFTGTKLTMNVIIAGGVFFLNHLFSFCHDKQKQERRRPNIGRLLSFPFIRIVPMHAILYLAVILKSRFNLSADNTAVLVVFLLLKTIADVWMHIVQRRGFVDNPALDVDFSDSASI